MFLGRRALLGTAPAFAIVTPAPALVIGAAPGPVAAAFGQIKAIRGNVSVVVHQNADVGLLDHEVTAGRAFGNACHTRQSLAAENAAHGMDLVPVFPVLTLPCAVYSKRRRSRGQLAKGDTILLPAEPDSYDRARVLLYNFGLLRAHEDGGLAPDLSDIVNPIGFRLERVPSTELGRALPRVDAAVIPYEAAVAAGLDPARDSIGMEDARSPFAVVFAVRRINAASPDTAAIRRAFESRDMRRFIYRTYGDSVGAPW